MRDHKTKNYVEKNYQPFREGNTSIVSIVTVGEVLSTGKQNKWGDKKLEAIQGLLDSLVIVEIRYSDLIESYAEIDTFSQGKLDNKKVSFLARNMGKNDLWIAATAHVTGSKLITADSDFDHLNGIYFEVIKFVRQK